MIRFLRKKGITMKKKPLPHHSFIDMLETMKYVRATQSLPVWAHRGVLNVFILLLKICGIWSYDYSTPIIQRILFITYKTLIYSAITTFLITVLIDLLLNYNDLLIVTDDGCYLAGISVIAFKLYNFNKHHNRIAKLIEDVYQPLDVFAQSNDVGIQTLIKTTVLFEKITMSFFVTLAGFLVIALVLFVPHAEGELPIRAKFPFDTSVSPGYEIGFTLQTVAIAYGLYSIVAMDSTAVNLCRCICAQLKVLACNYQMCMIQSYERSTLKMPLREFNFVELFAVLRSSRRDRIIRSFTPFRKHEEWDENDSFVSRFELCKENHEKLIEIIREFNAVFGASMLMQVFASFSMICLTGFQAVLGAASKKSLLKFVVYLGAAVSQLVNWCWSGNEIIVQSSLLFESQWQSGWEHQLDNHEVKTLMLMSMTRTKRPLQLRAGNFFSMSLHTFLMILRNSYSFFAVLRTVTDSE